MRGFAGWLQTSEHHSGRQTSYGLEAKAWKRSTQDLESARYPFIVFWNFNHFLVVEGFRNGRVYVNDPASGPRTVPLEDFDRAYAGVMMTAEPGPEFRKGGRKPSVPASLAKRLRRSLVPVAAAIATALLLVIPGLAVPALMAAFVDQVLVQGLTDWGRPLVVGMLIATYLRAFLTGIQLRILRRLQNRLAVAETSRFVRHLLRLPASYYAQRYAGEVSSRIELNDQVADVLSGQLATTAIDILMMVFYMVVMWWVNWPLASLALFFASINFAVLRWIARLRREGNARLSVAQGKAAGVGIAGLQSIRTIKASGLESDYFARWAGFFANLANAQQEVSSITISGVLPPLLLSLMTAAVLAGGGIEVMHGRMSIRLLVAFLGLSTSFLQPVNNLVALGQSMQELEGHITRLDERAAVGGIRWTRAKTRWRPSCAFARGNVEFRNVTFGYSPVSPPLIENLSFAARLTADRFRGRKRFPGKSTVARMLAGLYAPTGGEILLDE